MGDPYIKHKTSIQQFSLELGEIDALGRAEWSKVYGLYGRWKGSDDIGFEQWCQKTDVNKCGLCGLWGRGECKCKENRDG